MGFFETLSKGIIAAGEFARKEQEKQQRKYNNYSGYSDEYLHKIAEGKDDDGFFGPHSSTEKNIARKVLQDRYRR